MLEATQTGRSPILFKAGRQWEGRVVGNYRLRQYLGSTDHSAVFLTELGGDESRKAAIKLIAADDPTSSVQLDRWRLAMKVSHPHTLQIFDVGRCQISGDDLLFVVMEYADENLSQILPERALTEAEMREMIQPTVEALAYLHENGFAHGRLKPSNIMAAGERLKLSSDSIGGTGGPSAASISSPYDAPETAESGISPAADVWSLATVIAQALTQRLPEWKNRLLEEPALPQGIQEPFADIARHCLLREPSKRWTVAQIRTRMEPLPLPQPRAKTRLREIKPLKFALKIKWIYVVPALAFLGTIFLLANIFNHKTVNSAKVAEVADSNVPTSAAQPQKQSASHKGRSAKPEPSTNTSFAPGRVARQVVPDVPRRALATIRGTVRVTVKVHVNATGDVAKAEFVSSGPSRYFANLAMQAAQEWKFTPGSEQRALFIRFDFENSGVTAHPHG